MSEFPFITDVQNAKLEKELPLFREYAWDFSNQCFIYDQQGKHIIVEGIEAVKVWIFKALQTERYRYLAYSWQYGLELEPFIGRVITVQERLSELRRCIIECLMVNPYIRAICNMKFEVEKDSTICTFDCNTIYGEARINV